MVTFLKRLAVSLAMVSLSLASAGADEPEVVEPVPPAPEAKPVVANLQRDFATKLIQELNLGSMPKKVRDKNLLNVLNGQRTLVVEAENYYDKKRDAVTLRPYNTIGTFSGKGWLSAPANPTSVTFKYRFPLAGVYQMKIRGAGNGQLWSIGGKAFKVDCGKTLKDVEVGTVVMDAELATFNVVLPPDGAIDFISFTSPSLHPIAPYGGWQFDAPLTYGAAAEVAVMLLKNTLPLETDAARPVQKVPVAGNASLPTGVSLVNDPIYGKFYGPGWFRGGYIPARVELPFTTEVSAYYDVRVRWFGDKVVGNLDGMAVEGKGKPYLEWVDLGIFYLAKGKHQVHFDLPSNAGVDMVELAPMVSSTDACLKLLGWQYPAQQIVTDAEFDRLIKDLAVRYQAATAK